MEEREAAEWKLKQLKHYKQTDSYNCGVLCLQFIECLVNNTSLENIMNPDKYRGTIKNDLIKYGNINCMHCEDTTSPSVYTCNKCCRGVDEGCYNYVSSLLKPSEEYSCFLCQ